MMPDQVLVFETQLLRAALEEDVSEKLGNSYRKLCGLAEKLPKPAGGKDAQTVSEEKAQILEELRYASEKFFAKMRTRLESRIATESPSE